MFFMSLHSRIKHFGGSVTYDSRDFVSRNRDALDRELSQAMYECDHPILKVLFPEGKKHLHTFIIHPLLLFILIIFKLTQA